MAPKIARPMAAAKPKKGTDVEVASSCGDLVFEDDFWERLGKSIYGEASIVLLASSARVSVMAKSFNPRVPKRGRARQVLKRPAHKKKGNWQQVPYVRDLEAQVPPRGDRHAWKRSLVDVVKCSVSSVVSMLRADNLLPTGSA